MSVIKEMRIKVASEITELTASGAPSGTPEITHENAGAFLHLNDGGMLITYMQESDGVATSSDIEINGGAVLVRRSGGVTSSFLFEEGVSHKSLYSVGPYSFDAEIKTRRIRQGIGENGGRLDLYYTMTIGGADKSVRMSIELSPVG